MNKRKSIRSEDDVPIIGDYSEGQNARLAAGARQAPSSPRAPRAPRGDSRARDDQWLLDPGDVRRYAQLARQRERRGPLAKALRYSPIALVVVLAFIVYWNFETLRGITVDYSALTSLFGGDASVRSDGAPRVDGEPQAVSVEAPVVVGTDVLSSVKDAAPDLTPPTVDASSDVLPATEQSPPRSEPPAEEIAPAPTVEPAVVPAAEELERVSPPVPPPAPPAPETFAFGVFVNSVSESDAAAAVIILRNGGDRGESSVRWWTSDGTATAGADYADLGTVVERFPPGAQNRTIRIPIIGDSVVEGPETFYVHLATSESDGAPSERARTEVVINDDD